MNGGGGYRLFHPGHQLLTCWAGACPFLRHKLQGHSQQPACGSRDASPALCALLSLCWPPGIRPHLARLKFGSAFLRKPPLTSGVFMELPFGNFSSGQSYHSLCAVCLPRPGSGGHPASLRQHFGLGEGLSPSLEGLPLPGLSSGHPGADTGSVHPGSVPTARMTTFKRMPSPGAGGRRRPWLEVTGVFRKRLSLSQVVIHHPLFFQAPLVWQDVH